MKLTELSKKPTLVKLVIDREDLVEKYGEELEFHVYDRQPIHVFSKIAASSKSDDLTDYLQLLQDTVLDDNGNPVMTEENLLPLDLLTECMKLIGTHLGK